MERHKWQLRGGDNYTKTKHYQCKKCGLHKETLWIAPYTTRYINDNDGEITDERPNCIKKLNNQLKLELCTKEESD